MSFVTDVYLFPRNCEIFLRSCRFARTRGKGETERIARP